MEKPGNSAIVIFGASGDLTFRKLVPALYTLSVQDLLPERFAVIGSSRSEMSTAEFREKIEEGIRRFSGEKVFPEEKLKAFLGITEYLPLKLDDPGEYRLLENLLCKIRDESGIGGNCLFYLATPPVMFDVISGNLGSAGLNKESEGYRRIIIEKPFGRDLVSARELNRKLLEFFSEEQIYRIDHYLGKETVQNLLVTRFANGIFEPLWNRNYVDHVEITSAESIGVEARGGYYDSAGALRDMVQNHLLQLVGMTAMEPPSSMDSDWIRNEKLKVMHSLRPIREEEVGKFVVRGQYLGRKIKGVNIPGYREEKGVNPQSRTETFVAIKFFIDNWRWGGVPFYIRTGKRLPTQVTEIVIHFKATPHALFSHKGISPGPNQLVIRIQPDEGISIRFGMKLPGAGFVVRNVKMDFHYDELANVRLPSAYERLLYDALMGDSTLYSRGDAVEAAWKFIDPIQRAWAGNPAIRIYGYSAGTWGPRHANSLIDGREYNWQCPGKHLSDFTTDLDL
jgi:glucose-6-phosphate 1-dehydrogenase